MCSGRVALPTLLVAPVEQRLNDAKIIESEFRVGSKYT